MASELCQREAELLALMLVGIAQLQSPGPDRPRAAVHRADGLTAVPGSRWPGGDELLHAQIASPVSAPAGCAELIWQQCVTLAAQDPAGPESQQRMIRSRRQDLSLGIPSRRGQETGVQEAPQIPGLALVAGPPGIADRLGAHRVPPSGVRAETRSTAWRSRS
jgi:hypothetical protein